MAKLKDLDALTELDASADYIYVYDQSAQNDTHTTPNALINASALAGRVSAAETRLTTAETKLNTVETGAEKNVQADFNQTDETADDFIKNKPAGLTVDSEISTTSENSLQNKVITTNLNTYINIQSVTTPKTISFSGFSGTPPDGFYCKVMFKNGHNGTALTLNGISVKVNKCGSLVSVPYHTISETNKILQAYTVLELYYDASASCWVVLGNPEVITYTSDTVAYRIKADGLISINGQDTSYSVNTVRTITLPVEFSNLYYWAKGQLIGSDVKSSSGSSVKVNRYSSSVLKIYTNSHYDDKITGLLWECSGY